MLTWLDRIPLYMIIFAVLFLGLAPFQPEPHIWEKLKLLGAGELRRPIDIFDFIMHGLPWAALGIKLVRGKRGEQSSKH